MKYSKFTIYSWIYVDYFCMFLLVLLKLLLSSNVIALIQRQSSILHINFYVDNEFDLVYESWHLISWSPQFNLFSVPQRVAWW